MNKIPRYKSKTKLPHPYLRLSKKYKGENFVFVNKQPKINKYIDSGKIVKDLINNSMANKTTGLPNTSISKNNSFASNNKVKKYLLIF